jgi:hypothetical protein
MLEGVGTLANLNHEAQTVASPHVYGTEEKALDAVEGKVNAITPSDESSESSLEDKTNRHGSAEEDPTGEGHIVDVMS